MSTKVRPTSVLLPKLCDVACDVSRDVELVFSRAEATAKQRHHPILEPAALLGPIFRRLRLDMAEWVKLNDVRQAIIRIKEGISIYLFPQPLTEESCGDLIAHGLLIDAVEAAMDYSNGAERSTNILTIDALLMAILDVCVGLPIPPTAWLNLQLRLRTELNRRDGYSRDDAYALAAKWRRSVWDEGARLLANPEQRDMYNDARALRTAMTAFATRIESVPRSATDLSMLRNTYLPIDYIIKNRLKPLEEVALVAWWNENSHYKSTTTP